MKIIETEFTNEIDACEYNVWDEVETKEHTDNCIKIADNHAIKFADFLNSGRYTIWGKSWIDPKKNKDSEGHWIFHTTKELLEIFKDESNF